jgi:hypothetical protein
LVTLESVYDTIGSYNRVKPKHRAPDRYHMSITRTGTDRQSARPLSRDQARHSGRWGQSLLRRGVDARDSCWVSGCRPHPSGTALCMAPDREHPTGTAGALQLWRGAGAALSHTPCVWPVLYARGAGTRAGRAPWSISLSSRLISVMAPGIPVFWDAGRHGPPHHRELVASI